MTEHVFSPNHQLTEEELFCLQGCQTYAQYFKMRRSFELKNGKFDKIDLASKDPVRAAGFAHRYVSGEVS